VSASNSLVRCQISGPCRVPCTIPRPDGG
jgi:hypothetical protein